MEKYQRTSLLFNAKANRKIYQKMAKKQPIISNGSAKVETFFNSAKCFVKFFGRKKREKLYFAEKQMNIKWKNIAPNRK